MPLGRPDSGDIANVGPPVTSGQAEGDTAIAVVVVEAAKFGQPERIAIKRTISGSRSVCRANRTRIWDGSFTARAIQANQQQFAHYWLTQAMTPFVGSQPAGIGQSWR